MKFAYKLKRLCGSVYENGNISFTFDGNSVISPVGNRATMYQLIDQTTCTLPYENKRNIDRIACSNNGLLLISIDIDGYSIIFNLRNHTILQRFSFRSTVTEIKFAPNDESFAVTCGNECQIWKTPCIKKEFSPLVLSRILKGFSDSVTCLDWSFDSQNIVIGSKELISKVFTNVHSKFMSKSVLSGHRDQIIGVYFSEDGNIVYSIASDCAVFTWKSTFVANSVSNNKSDPTINSDVDEDESDEENEVLLSKKIMKKWELAEREFLWDSDAIVVSTAYHHLSGLLVIGFSTGVFGLYEMPGCVNVHRLSVSTSSLTSVAINCTGEWLGIGSSQLGQLVVWEWKSESYIIKQQGHLYGLKSVDYSNDGLLIATGGEDGKVKIWNAISGFCFLTFTVHLAPVTGVRFTGKGYGKALLSCSLDGTIQAHDMLRYKNFRTMVTPTPMQLTSLAVDPSGEVVCASTLDPFNIFVWSLQTGRLLDVLSGHESPVACLEFSKGTKKCLLASGSWDGTVKLWDVFKNENVETFEHGCDVLAVAFRPDGEELCTANTNGNLTFWEVETGTQISVIEGRRDISGGRLTSDAMTANNSARSKYFTSVVYTADGLCVLAAGRSKYACIYAVATGMLIKKYQMSYNRSLEGIVDELRSDRLVDGISLEQLVADSAVTAGLKKLPGAGKGSGIETGLGDGSRTTRPELVTSALGFSPTGREWAAATTQGLQIFSLDDAILFAPTDLDCAITPQAAIAASAREEYALAINMALHLQGERNVLKQCVDAVPMQSIELVIKTVDGRMTKELMKFLAEELATSPHLEYYLRWCWEMLKSEGFRSQQTSLSILEGVRSLIRAVSNHEKEILKMTEENRYMLDFLKCQGQDVEVVNSSDSMERPVEAMEVDGQGSVWIGQESSEESRTAMDFHTDSLDLIKRKRIDASGMDEKESVTLSEKQFDTWNEDLDTSIVETLDVDTNEEEEKEVEEILIAKEGSGKEFEKKLKVKRKKNRKLPLNDSVSQNETSQESSLNSESVVTQSGNIDVEEENKLHADFQYMTRGRNKLNLTEKKKSKLRSVTFKSPIKQATTISDIDEKWKINKIKNRKV